MGKGDENGCGGSCSSTALRKLLWLRCTSLKHLASGSWSASSGSGAHGGRAAVSGNGSGAELSAIAALSGAPLLGDFAKSSWNLGSTMGNGADANGMNDINADNNVICLQTEAAIADARDLGAAPPGIANAQSHFDVAAASDVADVSTPIPAAAAAAATAGAPVAADVTIDEAVLAFPPSWAPAGADDGVSAQALAPAATACQFEGPSAAATLPTAAITSRGACLPATAADEESLSGLTPILAMGSNTPLTKEGSPTDASAAAADVAPKVAPSPVSSAANTARASPPPQAAAAAAAAAAKATHAVPAESDHSAGDRSAAPILSTSHLSASNDIAASTLSSDPEILKGLSEEVVASLMELTPQQLQMLSSLAGPEAHTTAASLLAKQLEVGVCTHAPVERVAATAAPGAGRTELPQLPGKDGSHTILEAASLSHDLPRVCNLQRHSDVAVSVHEQTEWMLPGSAYPEQGGVADVAVNPAGTASISAAPPPTVPDRRHFVPLKPIQIAGPAPTHRGAPPLSYMDGSLGNCTSALRAKSSPTAGVAPATAATTAPMPGLLGSPVSVSLKKSKYIGLLRPRHNIGTGTPFSLLRTSPSAASQRSSRLATSRSLFTTRALATSPKSDFQSPMSENVPIVLKKPGSGTSPAWQIAVKNHHRELQVQVRQQHQQQLQQQQQPEQDFQEQQLEQLGEGAVVALPQGDKSPRVEMHQTQDRAATGLPSAMSRSLSHGVSISDAEGNGTPCLVEPSATFDLARLARALKLSYNRPLHTRSASVREASSGAVQTPHAVPGKSGLSASAGAASLAAAAPYSAAEAANSSGTGVSLRNKRKWLPHASESEHNRASEWGVSSPCTAACGVNGEKGLAATQPRTTLWDCLNQISSGPDGGYGSSVSHQASLNALDLPACSVAPEPFSISTVAEPDVQNELHRHQKQEQQPQPQQQQQERTFHALGIPKDPMPRSVLEQHVQDQQQQWQGQQQQPSMLPPPEQQQWLHQQQNMQRLLQAPMLVRNLDALVPEPPPTKKARLNSPVIPKVHRATLECDDVDVDALLWEDDQGPAGDRGGRGRVVDGNDASDPIQTPPSIGSASRQLSHGLDAAASANAGVKGGADEALVPADENIKPKSLLEKRRRARIRDKLEQLQAILPHEELGVGSTTDVLKAAILHIKSLEARLKQDKM